MRSSHSAFKYVEIDTPDPNVLQVSLPHLDIAYYLLNAHRQNFLFLGLNIDQNHIDELVLFSKDSIIWNRFKKDLNLQIQKIGNELSTENRCLQAGKAKEEKKIYFAKLKQEHERLKIKLADCNKIDSFLKNQRLQNLLLVGEEIKKYFPSYLTFKHIEDKASYLQAHPRLVHLLIIVNTEAAFIKQHSHEDNLYLQGTEFSCEFLSSTAEILEKTHHIETTTSALYGSEFLHTNAPSTETASTSNLGHALTTLRHIGVVNNFVRGLIFLKEAWEAFKDPHIGQRKMKIAAGIFGGFVSIGLGIVGALFLAGVGLLGTAAATFAVPIAIGAAITGVYAAALYRDSYSLHQTNKKLASFNIEISKVEYDIAETKENLLRHFFHQCQEDADLSSSATAKKGIDLQKNINQLHHQIEELTKVSPNDKQIPGLLTELKSLWEERSALINTSPKLKEKIKIYLQNDPKLLRQKASLYQFQIYQHRLKADQRNKQKNVALSILCTIGIGLALGAVLATDR